MDVPMFLVMSGSMGFGKLAVFAAELALRCRNGEHIVIICGNNAKIERILRKEFHFNKRVHIIGYTNHVSLFMDACDVIYTKPGGLTSTESLVKNIPIVHTAPIPGCETANLQFFAARHLSVSSKQHHLGILIRPHWQEQHQWPRLCYGTKCVYHYQVQGT